MESGVDFTAADFPTANRLTVHILAAVAEHEARMISERTKAALAAAKARGVRLGGHRGRSGTAEDCARAREAQTRRSEERARDLEPLFDRLDPAGDLSLRAIAKALQEEGVPTVSGRGRWTAAGVARVRERNKILSRCDSPLRNRYIKEGNLSGEFDDPPSDRTVVRNLY